MNDEYIGIIRRGWIDAAQNLAPHVTGLAEMLEARLDEAIQRGPLDEAALLPIVEDATQTAVDSGSAEVSVALGKRLRRTVYEYLLSLDAGPSAGQIAAAEAAGAPSTGMVGADEVAALKTASAGPLSMTEIWAAEHPEEKKGSPPEAPVAESPAPHRVDVEGPPPSVERPRRFNFFDRGQPPAAQGGPPVFSLDGEPAAAKSETAAPSGTPETPATTPQATSTTGPAAGDTEPSGGAPDDDAQQPLAPRVGFHIGDPSDFVAQAPSSLAAARENPGEIPTAFSDPSTWPTSGAPSPAEPEFHEVTRETQESNEANGSREDFVAQRPARWSASWPAQGTGQAPSQSQPPPTPGDEAGDAEPGQPASTPETSPEAPVSRRGWAMRDAQAVRLAAGDTSPSDRVNTHTLLSQEAPEADLQAARASIDEKLRKKKCDQAAAVLQQVAQEHGGRQVAELALDVGDRCRGLGKSNAATNCYIAAVRADPVYEAPLARLADICIDDQDIDLAVTYLERIARLTRLRGDNNGALRIYRKIATVAPYRDDILELLMHAQQTGRLER